MGWSRAQECSDRAIEHMKRALDATDPDERKHSLAIAADRELALFATPQGWWEVCRSGHNAQINRSQVQVAGMGVIGTY